MEQLNWQLRLSVGIIRDAAVQRIECPSCAGGHLLETDGGAGCPFSRFNATTSVDTGHRWRRGCLIGDGAIVTWSPYIAASRLFPQQRSERQSGSAFNVQMLTATVHSILRDFFRMVECGSITKRSHPSRLIYFKKSQKQTTFIEGTRAQTGFLPVLRRCRTPAISGNPF